MCWRGASLVRTAAAGRPAAGLDEGEQSARALAGVEAAGGPGALELSPQAGRGMCTRARPRTHAPCCQWITAARLTGAAGRAELVREVREMQKVLGGSLDPHAAYLLLRGMKTLKLRVAHQNATCIALARRLEAHPKVGGRWGGCGCRGGWGSGGGGICV